MVWVVDRLPFTKSSFDFWGEKRRNYQECSLSSWISYLVYTAVNFLSLDIVCDWLSLMEKHLQFSLSLLDGHRKLIYCFGQITGDDGWKFHSPFSALQLEPLFPAVWYVEAPTPLKLRPHKTLNRKKLTEVLPLAKRTQSPSSDHTKMTLTWLYV